METLDLIKYPIKIKEQRLLLICAPISELSSNINTMSDIQHLFCSFLDSVGSAVVDSILPDAAQPGIGIPNR